MTLVYNGTNWVQATPTSQLLVTANGSSAYLFTGAGFPSTSGDNPTLHLKKGQTYYFINNSGGSHPFRIQSTTGTGGTPIILELLPIIMLLLVQLYFTYLWTQQLFIINVQTTEQCKEQLI